MSVGLKDFLTGGAKPCHFQIVIMNNKAFYELYFMLRVTYHFAEISSEAGNISVFLPDKWKLNISEIKNISKTFFNKLKKGKPIIINRYFFPKWSKICNAEYVP